LAQAVLAQAVLAQGSVEKQARGLCRPVFALDAMAEEEAAATTAAEEPKEAKFEGVVTGKYNWGADTKNRAADADIAGEAITKYAWSDGKKTVSVYVEMEGLDDVADEALTTESGEKDCSLTIAAIGSPPKKKTLTLSGLSNEIDGVKLTRKKGKNMVVLKLQKKEEKSWFQLLEGSGGGGGGDDDDMGGMGGMMGGMGGMMGGMMGGGMMGGGMMGM